MENFQIINQILSIVTQLKKTFPDIILDFLPQFVTTVGVFYSIKLILYNFY